MDSAELRKLAEDNLGEVLKRSKQNGGVIGQGDLASAALFCRVVEAETTGSPYAGAGLLNGYGTIDALAHVAETVRA